MAPGRGPKCQGCGHLVSLHLGDCWCGCEGLRPPVVVREVPATGIQRLIVMVMIASRGLAAAETLATALGAQGGALDDVAAARMALVDLTHALAALRDRGLLPDPIRRWTLGMPPWVAERPTERRRRAS